MGRGVLLGVRVQVGMGVREAVGVSERRAMNVLLRSVQMASAVKVPLTTEVREGVSEAVAVNSEVKVSVAEADCIKVWLGKGVSTAKEVEVQEGGTVGARVGEKIWPMTGLPKNMNATENSVSAVAAASHCHPAIIRARRVR